MEFRVLGPLEVVEQGHPIELHGRRQRALLACLLLHANEVVATERLLDDLWPGGEDCGARPRVGLAGAQGSRRGARADPTARLRASGGGRESAIARSSTLSRWRDEPLSGMAGQKRQATLLRRALALWRGPAFADFAYEPFAQAEAARLEEARLACLEERVEADLALGEHGELIGELERLVHEEPLRERLRAQLMLALYRSGRQVEALELYRETRRVWSEELGIEPGAALRDLEAAILRQDEELELPEAAVRAQEPDRAPSEPRRSVPPETEQAAGTAPSGSLARKTVTLVLAEAGLSGPTEEILDPEVRRRIVARYLETASQVFSLHGASLERPLGDNLAAIFGVPRLHEDDALRAVRAALELREAVAHLNEELERERAVAIDVRIGIDTGEVLEGDPGSPEGLVSGEALGRATRLAQAAGAGEIVISEATHRLVRDAVRARTAEADVRGAAGRAFLLLDARSPETPRGSRDPVRRTPARAPRARAGVRARPRRRSLSPRHAAWVTGRGQVAPRARVLDRARGGRPHPSRALPCLRRGSVRPRGRDRAGCGGHRRRRLTGRGADEDRRPRR